MWKEVKALMRKEMILEWRQKYAISGIVLYVAATVFVSYLSFHRIVDVPTWNALFWIIMLFAAVNSVSKSFLQESRGRLLYYYTIASPQSIILSKIMYNGLLLGVISILCFGIYAVLLSNPVNDIIQFLVVLLLGTAGFSSVLTLMSAIASKTNNNVSLMAILSFPILIPLLITLIRASKNAIDGLSWDVNLHYIIALIGLNFVVLMLSYILFPYLWRD